MLVGTAVTVPTMWPAHPSGLDLAGEMVWALGFSQEHREFKHHPQQPGSSQPLYTHGEAPLRTISIVLVWPHGGHLGAPPWGGDSRVCSHCGGMAQLGLAAPTGPQNPDGLLCLIHHPCCHPPSCNCYPWGPGPTYSLQPPWAGSIRGVRGHWVKKNISLPVGRERGDGICD